MKKTKFRIIIYILVFFFSLKISAQGKITGFKETIEKGEKYGVQLIIEPLTFEPGKAEYEGNNRIWGALICYTYKGKNKAYRQDITYDIKTKGKYIFNLSYGSDDQINSIKNLKTTIFNIKETSEELMPKKGDCFN